MSAAYRIHGQQSTDDREQGHAPKLGVQGVQDCCQQHHCTMQNAGAQEKGDSKKFMGSGAALLELG